MADGRIKSFFSELRRRRVLKVGVAYIVVGFGLIEFASQVFSDLLLPEWSSRLVTILVLIGFPLIIVLTWVFDITPSGIQRTPDIADSDNVKDDSRDSGASDGSKQIPPTFDEAVASVAVLPFDDLSPDGGRSIFGNGIAAEIHNTLSKLHRVRVASRRSAFRLADEAEGIETIAEALNVRYVLSGSLMRDDGRIRVFAELDDAVNATQIWSEKYERDLDDILAVQAEIAESIVAAFGGERQRVEIECAQKMPTENLDAWSLVQKARHYILSYGRKSLDESQQLLEKGIELDPEYAAAHAALGSVLAERVFNGFSDEPEADQKRAIAAIQTAETLAKNDSFVLKMGGMVWATCGDPEQSIRLLRASVELAPFDFGAWGYFGWPLVARDKDDDLDEVHVIIDRLLNQAPEHAGVPYWLFHKSVAYVCQDDLEQAADFVRQAIDKHGNLSWVWMHQANILGLQGQARDARRAAGKAAQLNYAMTPAHYAARISAMGGSASTLRMRINGLQKAALIGRLDQV